MWNMVTLAAARFCFGAGQATAFPNLTKAFTIWLPTHERVRAQGIMWMSARWGGAFTPLLVMFTLRFVDWRTAFALFALLGLLWAGVFWLWFRDNPALHSGTNEAELEIIRSGGAHSAGHGDVPWGKLLRSRSVLGLWLQYFVISYPWYFYITWLPTYLQEYRHVSAEESARLAVFPLFFGGIGCLFSGYLAPHAARWLGGVGVSRRMVACIGFLGASTMLLLSIHAKDPLQAMLLMGLASFSNDLVMPPAWGACMDVGGKYAGTLSGSMNMMGNLAGFVAPVTGGFLLAATGGNWNIFLYSMVAFYLSGVAIWPFIDPVTPLEKV
jgi:MFS family permease